MKTFTLGNDVTLRWKITRTEQGESVVVDFANADVDCFIIYKHKEIAIAHTINDKGEIVLTIPGNAQQRGVYGLKVRWSTDNKTKWGCAVEKNVINFSETQINCDECECEKSDVTIDDVCIESTIIAGEDGKPGINGKSAYDLYVESVPSDKTPLTLDKWLASMKGEDGKSAYQTYLDTTTDEPKLSEAEWSEKMSEAVRFTPQTLTSAQVKQAKKNLKLIEAIPNALVSVIDGTLNIRASFNPKNTQNLYLGLFRWKQSHSKIKEYYNRHREYCLLNDNNNVSELNKYKIIPLKYEDVLSYNITELVSRFFTEKEYDDSDEINGSYFTKSYVRICPDYSSGKPRIDRLLYRPNIKIFGLDENSKILQTMSQRCAFAYFYSPNEIFNKGSLQIGAFTLFTLNNLGRVRFNGDRLIYKFGK